MLRQLHYYISYDVMLKYICAQKQITTYLKNENIFKKLLK